MEGGYTPSEWKRPHPMIKRKKHLATHKGSPNGGRGGGGRGGCRDSRGGRGGRGDGGNKRAIAALEAELAETNKKYKGLEERLDGLEAGADDEGASRSNAGNPALDAHGGTRNKFRKQNP